MPSTPNPHTTPTRPAAARPAGGVRRMDFVVKRPAAKAAPHLATKPAPKPAGVTRLHPAPQITTPAPKPTPVRVAAGQAAPVRPTTPRPTAPAARPAAQPRPVRLGKAPAAQRPATRPAAKATPRPAPTPRPASAPRKPLVAPAPNPRAKKPAEPEFGIIEEYHSVEIETTTISPSASQPDQAAVKKPDNKPSNNPARNWPFLSSVNVDKRPLSAIKKAAAPKAAKTAPKPVVSSVVLNSISTGKKSKAPLIILLIVTILLGIAVGAAVYFCIFGV